MNKGTAIAGLIAAAFVAAVAFYPPLKPVCVALKFCADDNAEPLPVPIVASPTVVVP